MSINESQFRALLDRYLKGQATEQESKTLEDFFNSYSNSEGENQPSPDFHELDKAEIFAKINARTSVQHFEQNESRSFPWLKIAAAIAFVFVSYLIYSVAFTESKPEQLIAVETITEQTNKGEKSSFQLPDGTVVHLNANSKLTYPAKFLKTRSVKLSGEAYFEVVHDKDHPFEVMTSSSAVRVLGTSFNVKAQPESNMQVTLVTGKVNVNAKSHELTLDPGYQATFENDMLVSRKVNIDKYISWKENVIFFEDTRLEEAVLTLEQWFNTRISINSPSLKKCTITGQYKGESLENVLKSLEFLLNAKVDYSDLKNITIAGAGCKSTKKLNRPI